MYIYFAYYHIDCPKKNLDYKIIEKNVSEKVFV